jgi:NADPH:quinone reductase-like Zn-dependent oxidoreductase
MAVGREGMLSAGLGLARLKLWNVLSILLKRRRAVFYSITARRLTHPEEFKTDMMALFKLLHEGAIHPVVVERAPLAAASGKIVLLPWLAS